MTDPFYVKFWGVRGSIACPGPHTIRYGGNTSCLEVRAGTHRLVFDAGTGLKNYGDELVKNGQNELDIFLTHTHIDHLNGFPFFKPAYAPGNTVRVWAGHLKQQGSSVREQLDNLMAAPLFPVGVDIMASDIHFNDFNAGETIDIGDGVVIKTAPLNHPNGATGYRIEYQGKSICYVTDTEHVPGTPDQNVLQLIEGTDIFIYDSNFTDEEFPNFVHWGHSTWQEGVRLSDQAGVKTFVAFHHDPSHDDAFMDRVTEELEQARPGSRVAVEGQTLTP